MTAQELPITVVPTDKKNWSLHPEYVTAAVDAKSGIFKRGRCDFHMRSVSTAWQWPFQVNSEASATVCLC
jgi:hypothetical protein